MVIFFYFVVLVLYVWCPSCIMLQFLMWDLCSLLMFVEDARGEHMDGLQPTQPTRGGAFTPVWQPCANCVDPSRPQQWVPDYRFFKQAGHADPLDG